MKPSSRAWKCCQTASAPSDSDRRCGLTDTRSPPRGQRRSSLPSHRRRSRPAAPQAGSTRAPSTLWLQLSPRRSAPGSPAARTTPRRIEPARACRRRHIQGSHRRSSQRAARCTPCLGVPTRDRRSGHRSHPCTPLNHTSSRAAPARHRGRRLESLASSRTAAPAPAPRTPPALLTSTLTLVASSTSCTTSSADSRLRSAPRQRVQVVRSRNRKSIPSVSRVCRASASTIGATVISTSFQSAQSVTHRDGAGPERTHQAPVRRKHRGRHGLRLAFRGGQFPRT
jgi:hypothetical protein